MKKVTGLLEELRRCVQSLFVVKTSDISKSPLRLLLESSRIYAIGSIILATLPIASLSILTHLLNVTELGEYIVYVTVSGLLVPLVNLGLSNIIVRDYIHQDKLNFPLVISSCLAISASSLVLIGIAGFFLNIVIPRDVSCVASNFVLSDFASVLVITFSLSFQPTVTGICVIATRPWLSIGFRILPLLLFTMLSGAAFFLETTSSTTVLRIRAVAELITITVSFLWLIKNRFISAGISIVEIRRCIIYTLPLIFQMGSASVIGSADRFALAHFQSTAATAIYNVAYQIGSCMSLIVYSTTQAIQPLIYGYLKNDSQVSRRNTRGVFFVVILSWLILATALWLIAPFFLGLIAPESYLPAISLTPWIILAFLFHGFYSLLSNYFYFNGNTGAIAIATGLAAIINVILMVNYIPSFGEIGAAKALAATYLLLFIFLGAFKIKAVQLNRRVKDVLV